MTTKTFPNLSQHCGSLKRFRYGFMKSFLFTEGVQDLAEQAGAYWLIDLVASHQVVPKVKREPFQLWSLRKLPEGAKNAAVAECRRDSGEKAICKQLIPYTDFPFPSGDVFEWYVCDNEIGGKTMLLKSEY